jgi:hypothetical protein
VSINRDKGFTVIPEITSVSEKDKQCTSDHVVMGYPRTCQESSGGSGLTVIDIDGPGGYPPKEVWCDNDKDGGGWML